MTTVALYNIKGGVGKTAGCVNLAYLAAEDGKKVCVWDLDPQGSGSYYFQVQPKLKGGLKKLLQGDSSLADVVQATQYPNLDLVPADFSNRHLDLVLDELKQAKKRFKGLVAQLADKYDYLFIDCPPGIGLLSEAIFAAADYVVVPTIPTTLSLRTWDMIRAFFDENGIDQDKLRGFFSMADIRKTLHNEVLNEFYRNKQFLKNYIPYLSVVEKMGTRLAPVVAFAPSSYGAQCFKDVWKELKKSMQG